MIIGVEVWQEPDDEYRWHYNLLVLSLGIPRAAKVNALVEAPPGEILVQQALDPWSALQLVLAAEESAAFPLAFRYTIIMMDPQRIVHNFSLEPQARGTAHVPTM